VIDLDGDDSNNVDDPTEIGTGLKSAIREGEAFPIYVGNVITNPDAFADPVVESGIMGPVYPTKVIGLGSTLSIGESVTLDGLIEHQGGHYLPNYTGYQNARRGVWTACYDVQEALVAYYDDGMTNALDNVTARMRGLCGINEDYGTDYDSDFWVEKADFWKLRNIALSWTIPENLLRGWTRSATVTLAGRNLYTWSDYSGSDPEVQDYQDQNDVVFGGGDFGRRDYYQIPNPRTFLLTFRVGF